MIRYRWWVVAIWTVLFLLGGYATSGLSDLLTNRFSLPGTDTARAETILEDHFGQKTVGSFTVVVQGQPGSAQQLLPIVRERAEAAAKELPTGHLASVQAVSDAVVSATIVSSLDPADAKGHTDDMRAAAGDIPGTALYVSGQAAIEHDLDPVFAHDLKVGELFIAIPIAALILAFVFGTLAFLLPLIFAAAAIPTTLGIIWIFAHVMELTTYLQNLVMLIGLGIAIDYSLLIVYRYREELRSGRSKEDAVVRTMETAGRAVVFSDSEYNFWWRLSRSVMRHARAVAAVTTAFLLLLALPVFWLEVGPGSNKGIPQNLEGVEGLNVISEAVGEGALAPTALVGDTGRPGGVDQTAVRAAIGDLEQGLRADPEVAAVQFGEGPQYVDASGRYFHINVVGKSEYGWPPALQFVHRLRDDIVPAAGFPQNVNVYAGGGPPSGVDFLDLTYGAFPWLVVGVLLLTYILLLRAFRSVLLPLKAIILNLLSIGAAYGLLVMFFKWGGAGAVGLISFEQIEGWIPCSSSR